MASQLPVDAWANDGHVLRAFGRIEESSRRKCAIEFAPTRTDLYRNLAAAKQLRVDDPHLVAGEAFAAGLTSLSEEERINLHFRRGWL